MIHLSYAIAQFFAILLGAIVRTVGGAIVAGLALVLIIVGIAAAIRMVSRRRR